MSAFYSESGTSCDWKGCSHVAHGTVNICLEDGGGLVGHYCAAHGMTKIDELSKPSAPINEENVGKETRHETHE